LIKIPTETINLILWQKILTVTPLTGILTKNKHYLVNFHNYNCSQHLWSLVFMTSTKKKETQFFYLQIKNWHYFDCLTVNRLKMTAHGQLVNHWLQLDDDVSFGVKWPGLPHSMIDNDWIVWCDLSFLFNLNIEL